MNEKCKMQSGGRARQGRGVSDESFNLISGSVLVKACLVARRPICGLVALGSETLLASLPSVQVSDAWRRPARQGDQGEEGKRRQAAALQKAAGGGRPPGETSEAGVR